MSFQGSAERAKISLSLFGALVAGILMALLGVLLLVALIFAPEKPPFILYTGLFFLAAGVGMIALARFGTRAMVRKWHAEDAVIHKQTIAKRPAGWDDGLASALDDLTP